MKNGAAFLTTFAKVKTLKLPLTFSLYAGFKFGLN